MSSTSPALTMILETCSGNFSLTSEEFADTYHIGSDGWDSKHGRSQHLDQNQPTNQPSSSLQEL